MGTTKQVNYTPTQTAELVEAYEAAGEGEENQEAREAVVQEFAGRFGKSAQSIRSKLTSEGVYIAKTYKTKTGAKPESKAKIVQDIAAVLGVADETVESLEKANKKALSLIRGTLIRAYQALNVPEGS